MPEVKLEKLLKLHKEREDISKNQSDLRLSLRELRTVTHSETSWETTINGLTTQFKEHMPDVCPLCNRKTTG